MSVQSTPTATAMPMVVPMVFCISGECKDCKNKIHGTVDVKNNTISWTQANDCGKDLSDSADKSNRPNRPNRPDRPDRLNQIVWADIVEYIIARLRTNKVRIVYSMIVPIYCIMAWVLKSNARQDTRRSSYYASDVDLLNEYLQMRGVLASGQFAMHLFVLTPARFFKSFGSTVIHAMGCCSKSFGLSVWTASLILCNFGIFFMTFYGWSVFFCTGHITSLLYKCCEVVILTMFSMVLLTRLWTLFENVQNRVFFLMWD